MGESTREQSGALNFGYPTGRILLTSSAAGQNPDYLLLKEGFGNLPTNLIATRVGMLARQSLTES